ncbi:MAG: hypothetical protein ACO4CS_14645 [bacterium]
MNTRKLAENCLEQLAEQGEDVTIIMDYILELEETIDRLEDELEITEQVLTQQHKKRRQKWDDE